jgi:hypothetical protein
VIATATGAPTRRSLGLTRLICGASLLAAFGIVSMVLADTGSDRVTSVITIGALVLPLAACVLAAWRLGRRAPALLGFAVPPLLLGAIASTRLEWLFDYQEQPLITPSTALLAAAAMVAIAALWSTARSKPSPVKSLMGGLAAGIVFDVAVLLTVAAWLFRNG